MAPIKYQTTSEEGSLSRAAMDEETILEGSFRGVDNFLEVGGLNILTCKWPHLLYDTSCAQDAS